MSYVRNAIQLFFFNSALRNDHCLKKALKKKNMDIKQKNIRKSMNYNNQFVPDEQVKGDDAERKTP